MFDLPPESPKFWLPPKPAIIRSVEKELAKPSLGFLPGVTPLVVAGRQPVSIVYLYNNFFNSGSSFTFTSVPLSAEAADRQIVVGVHLGNGTISTLTVAGSGATQRVTGGVSVCTLWNVALAAGTSGNIVINGSGFNGCGIGVWAVYGASSTPFALAGTSVAENPASEPIDIPANGGVTGFARVSVTSAFTWTGLTEDFDTAMSSTRYSGASALFASAQTGFTVTANSGTTSRLVVASWEQL